MRAPRLRVSVATIVVALALVAAIGVIVWVLTIVRSEPSPIAPTPEPTATVGIESTPVASPAATPGAGIAIPDLPLTAVGQYRSGTLGDLMRYAPDRLADDSLPLSDVAQYANISGWMSARQVETPEGPGDPAFEAWEAELEHLAIPSVLATRGNDEIWEDTYGFRLSDVNQVLAVGQAPDLVLVIRGDFDPSRLQDAWVESGYQAVRSEGITLWSLYPGDSVDLSAPASRPALGNMNNLVLLEDGTLIATSRLPRLEQAVRAFQGTGPSLDENPQMAALLAPATFPHRLDSAIILKGSILSSDPATPVVMVTPERKAWIGGATPIADLAAQPPVLPQATLMLVGLEAPPDPAALPVFSLVLSYEAADDAISAAIRADRTIRMADSPVTGQPYRDRIDVRGIRTWASEDGVFLLHLTAHLSHGGGDWLHMLEERDLGFVMWPWEP